MTDTITLTIDWREAQSELPEEQQEAVTQSLYQELRSLDEVQDVQRVPDPDVPEGEMGAQWLWNVLTADITVEGLKQVCQDVYARLPRKPIEFTLEVDGEKVSLGGKNIRPDNFDETLDKLVAAAQKLKDTQKSED